MRPKSELQLVSTWTLRRESRCAGRTVNIVGEVSLTSREVRLAPPRNRPEPMGDECASHGMQMCQRVPVHAKMAEYQIQFEEKLERDSRGIQESQEGPASQIVTQGIARTLPICGC